MKPFAKRLLALVSAAAITVSIIPAVHGAELPTEAQTWARLAPAPRKVAGLCAQTNAKKSENKVDKQRSGAEQRQGAVGTETLGSRGKNLNTATMSQRIRRPVQTSGLHLSTCTKI